MSPLSPVDPDDDPMKFCHTHNIKYNPYKHPTCPKCRNP